MVKHKTALGTSYFFSVFPGKVVKAESLAELEEKAKDLELTDALKRQ